MKHKESYQHTAAKEESIVIEHKGPGIDYRKPELDANFWQKYNSLQAALVRSPRYKIFRLAIFRKIAYRIYKWRVNKLITQISIRYGIGRKDRFVY